MNRENCRLYVNSEQYLHSSIADAKEAAKKYIPQTPFGTEGLNFDQFGSVSFEEFSAVASIGRK